MPLSEYEQRILEQMEEQLRSEDPDLAASISHIQPRKSSTVLIGIAAVLAGIALLVVGVASSYLWLSVIGFVVAFAGVAWATHTPSGSKKGKPKSAPRNPGFASTPKKQSTMDKFEERWERRRDERG